MFGVAVTSDSVGSNVPIFKFERSTEYDLLAVSHMEGFHVHFDGRSRICCGEPLCRLCGSGRPRRWIGFFAVMYNEDRYLVRVTAEAAMRLTLHPPAAGKVYRAKSVGSRRPLQIAQIGTAKAPQKFILERTELLRILGAIHGLGILPAGVPYEQLLLDAREAAKKVVDRECFA